MVATIKFKMNLAPLRKFSREIKQQNQSRTFRGPIGDMFKQWGKIYLAFVRRRFVKMSKGGWKRLKHARKRGSKGSAAVLRDTGTLYSALTIGMPGNLFKKSRNGIKVGFGGPSKHTSGKATIRDIAVFHDEGRGNLPQRKILAPPDLLTVNLMQRSVMIAVKKLGKKVEHAK